MNQDEVATLLPVLHESRALERLDHLPRIQSRKLCHSSGGNGDPALKQSTFLGNRLPVSRETFKVQRYGFLGVPLRLFQGLPLTVTPRQNRDECHVSASGASS
jgi:hypothetical protein